MRQPTRNDLSPLWLRSAMLGSTWAAVEIVLGSFLHNMRLPLTGTMLASVGVVILVAGQRIWPEHGLAWRAGIICALMKSISPSAVIIGPMIGIASEAFLVEAAVRLFGTNVVGLLVGGSVAALLPLIQKIVSLVIAYGPDITMLYVRLVEFAAESLNVPSLGPAEVLAVIGFASIGLGLCGALAGMVVGRRVRAIPHPQALRNGTASPFSPAGLDPDQRFSLPLLGLHAAAMVLGLVAIRTLPLWGALGCVLAYIGLALGLYPAVMRRLSRPRLWLEFAVVSLLAGLLLGEVRNPAGAWQWDGLRIGAEMSLRASVVVVGFSSIGVELRNPVVLSWFFRRGLGNLARALEVAFEALPQMISAFGDQKRFFRSPLQALASTIAAGVAWLDARAVLPAVHIITGERASGKTTFLTRLVDSLRARSTTVGGILAPGLWRENERVGFNVQEIGTDQTVTLCRTGRGELDKTVGPYVFEADGIAFGLAAGERALGASVQVLCIDEIGPLELKNEGWAPLLRRALQSPDTVLILVVRTSLVRDVEKVFGLRAKAEWHVSESDVERVATTVTAALSPVRDVTG